MTEKLYYEDAYITEFTAYVTGCSENKGRYEITLNRTAFFPEGGGQPGDTGVIGGAKVLDTVERDGEIFHICDRAVEDEEVSCKLNYERRFLHMQLHTGEHIFSGFVHQATGFDNVGFHMGENEVTVDFNGCISSELLTEIEDRTNKAIYENTEIIIIYPKREELADYDYRSKKEIAGQVRLVEIPGADLCACCGTHTKRTGEVGMVKVISCMNYKQGVRISLKIGKKALLDYREKNDSVAGISALLCAKPDEVVSAVEKLKESKKNSDYLLGETKKKLFSLMCENVSPELPAVFDDSGNADDARILADILKDKVKIAFAFSGNDEEGYKYSVASASENLRELGKALNAALEGRGGGKPEMIMGSVKADRKKITEFVENILRAGT